MAFTHFHVHSQYSILDGAASVPGFGGEGDCRRDEGNLVDGSREYVRDKIILRYLSQKGIKPILGVEAYVARVSLYNKGEAGGPFGRTFDYSGQEFERVFEFDQALLGGVRGWVLLSSAY